MPDPLVSLDQFAVRPCPRPPPFVCAAEDGYVYVAGEIDIATTPQLEQALAVALSRSPAVVLDLQDVWFLDSAGTRAIVMASVLARARGLRLVLLHGPPNVDRMFDLTGNADQVEFFEPTPDYAAVA
jgi:anti-sigma B factor antagonist